MSRKKQEVQLQQEIETSEEWEEMLVKEGLWVVDVYQEWCGPCAALVGNFRRLKNELGDPLLHFAMAKADTVDSLDKYRGRCEPCFLFYAGGLLVACVHGANAPGLLRTVTEQLAVEHRVQDGNAERKEVKDPIIASMEAEEKANIEDEEEKDQEEKKEITVALIKPDAVRNGKVEEIVEQMKASGIEILAEEEKQLTEDEAREFYAHMAGEEYFEDLVKFMSSGPCYALVLTKGQKGDNIIQEWRNMIGPTTVEEAREIAPESLRAKYGSDTFNNAVHGSDSPETAAREMAFFFPDLAHPTIKKVDSKAHLQRTLALIRPDAFRNHREEIMEKIKEAGFKIALQRVMTLTKAQAGEFYKEHADKPYFDELTTRMSSGPLMALGLARDDAVESWRGILGPTENAKDEAPESLRGQFAEDGASINMLHGSDSSLAAEKEINFFFPVEQTIAAIKPDGMGTKGEIIDKIHEAGFRIAARKETVITKEIAEKFYAEHKDKDYFDDLVNHMCSGPTMFMVLSREDAVTGWREVIGPTNPEEAKEEAPDSLRAQFGADIVHNAVHGSSNPTQAKESILEVFGNLEFNPDEMDPEEGEKAVEDAGAADANEPAPETADQQVTEEGVKVTKQEGEESQPQSEGADTEPKTEAEPDTTKSEAEPDTTKTKSDSDTTKSEADPDTSKSKEDSEPQTKSDPEPDTTKSEADPDTTKTKSDPDTTKSETEPDTTKGDSGEVQEKSESETKTEDAAATKDSTDATKDEGETKAEEGDTKAEEGDSKAEEGDTKAEEGDTKAADTEESKGETTDAGEGKGDTGSKGGEESKESGEETKSEQGDVKKEESETKKEETKSGDEPAS